MRQSWLCRDSYRYKGHKTPTEESQCRCSKTIPQYYHSSRYITSLGRIYPRRHAHRQVTGRLWPPLDKTAVLHPFWESSLYNPSRIICLESPDEEILEWIMLIRDLMLMLVMEHELACEPRGIYVDNKVNKMTGHRTDLTITTIWLKET